MLFNTQRCIVRHLRDTDFDGYLELHGNPEVMKYASGTVQNPEECRADLDSVIARYSQEKPLLLVYAIISKKEEFLGTCALVFEDDQLPEVGYRLCEKFWGMGYATEILSGLIKYCKDQLKIPQMQAFCYADNIKSIKVLEKCGFQLKNTLTDPKNGLCDRHYILDPEKPNSTSFL